ncbi:hypothetical protein [Clostridium beijerinckii]|nr:hypothetical protein [Clostridium beijerinckii]MBA8933100.1 hypothetical protein [Clostridium beijerinckii]NRT36952.1 hypothetical protein [Clostridium beijerinckii]NRT43614.1 hypothetical protein [Clostridium beijerinckii]NRU37302.1 hypothetical protein [Clostridium beijerinckii]NRZ22394.1 hypothetical protein [Clostridium beijerinckii]
MLLRDLLKEFILELEIRNYSKRTLKSYKNNNSLMFTFWVVDAYKKTTY